MNSMLRYVIILFVQEVRTLLADRTLSVICLEQDFMSQIILESRA